MRSINKFKAPKHARPIFKSGKLHMNSGPVFSAGGGLRNQLKIVTIPPNVVVRKPRTPPKTGYSFGQFSARKNGVSGMVKVLSKDEYTPINEAGFGGASTRNTMAERTPDEWHRLLNSDDPAERFLATVAMAIGSARDAMNPATYWVCAATISIARRDFYGKIAEQGFRLH